MSLYSQETLKNTLLTDKDTVKVMVNYRYIVATRMLYRDYLGLKKVVNQQDTMISIQEKMISSQKSSILFYQQNDSLLNIRMKNDSILIRDFDKKFKANRNAKIISTISVPVAAILSFLLGWYLH